MNTSSRSTWRPIQLTVPRCRGISLIEIMVAMVLGLVVVLGVVGVMGSNRQNARITESLSELQENSRTAFELIARDVRAARDTGCGPSTTVDTETLFPNPESELWWRVWAPVMGITGATDAVTTGVAAGDRIAGMPALQLQGTFDGWPLSNPVPASENVTSLADSPFAINDIVMVCDYSTLAAQLHEVQGVVGTTITIDPPTDVSNGQIARYRAVTWFVGNNGRPGEGGRSLYRVRYEGRGDDDPAPEEVLPGITEMRLGFRIGDDMAFTDPAGIAADAWPRITAVQITLTAESTQARVTTGGSGLTDADKGANAAGRMRRVFTHVIALRNSAE